MLVTELVSGDNKNSKAIVDIYGRQEVSILTSVPPKRGTSNRLRFFSQLVSANGDGTGTTNMIVDGSSTPQLFTISSNNEFDILLMKIAIVIEDNTVSHATFGALAALTNGIDISIFESGTETFLIEAGKKFADLITQTLAAAPFGDGATAFELLSTTGTADSQILPMNIHEMIPGGIRIGRGTQNRLQVEINDDLTSVNSFTVRAFGCKHFE